MTGRRGAVDGRPEWKTKRCGCIKDEIIGLWKLRRYGGNAVLGEAEANELIDAYDGLLEQNERQATNIDALYRQRRDAELACELTREENTRLLEQFDALREAALPFADGATCLDETCTHKVCVLNKALGVSTPALGLYEGPIEVTFKDNYGNVIDKRYVTDGPNQESSRDA